MKIHRFFRLFLYFFILSLFFLVFIKNSHAENDLCSQLYCSAGTYCQCIGVIYGNGVDACTYGQSSDCDCSCNSSASSFLPGTLVKTTTGERKIEDIRVGDEVLSFKDEKIAYSKVVRIFKYPKPYHYTLEAGEYMVKVTYNHPFYIGSNQFKIVEDLKIGDTVYVLENGQLTAKEITQKTRVEEESYVYNLTVDNTNTYFANDFAVHNKWAPPNPMGGENCAPNYTPNYSQVTRTFCTSDYKDTDIVEGNARKITGCCDNTHEDEEGNEVCNHHNYQWTDYACVPIATPTPTPWIRVVVKNPTGTAVNSKQICGVDCSGSVCTKKGAAYCSANDNDFTFSKFNSVNNRLGGRIALADQLNRAFIVVGVTPSVAGFAENTCNNIGGYCYVWAENSWSTGGRTVNFIVASPTPTPTPTTAPLPWIKIKDSSFISGNNLNNRIPVLPVAYDADDTPANDYFIRDVAGVVGAPLVNITALNPSAKTGQPEYKATYTPSSTVYTMTPTNFLSYVKSRKEYKKINDLSEIDADGIYYYQLANPTLRIDSIPSQFNSYNVVIISSGVVDINVVNFIPSKSVAILAPTINFSSVVQQASGIFIGDTVSTGTNATQGLKIIGNLIAQTSLINNRRWSDLNKPAIFIKFDQTKYINLLPYLSTANYQWRETQ